MLTIKPKVNSDNNSTVLMCSEDGVEKGYIAFAQRGYVLDVLGFEVYYATDDLQGEAYVIADTLIKSLGSYALNHSCFYIECHNPQLFTLLKKFEFAENDNYLTINLQQLFKVCKN